MLSRIVSRLLVLLLLCVCSILPAFAQSGAPSAPTGLSVQSGGSSSPTTASLTWNFVPTATSYNIYRSTTSGGEGSTPVVTNASVTASGDEQEKYTNTGLTSGTTYYYEVTAVNSSGESAKSNECAVTAGSTLLAAPSTVTAAAGNTQVTLNWPAVSGAASYDIFCAPTNPKTTSYLYWQTIAEGVTSTTYTDTGLANGTEYVFSVAGASSAGIGTDSPYAYATPGGSAPAPTNLTAASGGSSRPTIMNLSWNIVPGATTYNLYRSTTSGGEGGNPAVTSIYPPSGSAQIDTYQDTGLTASTEYYYQVTAVSAVGESPKSNEATATTGASSLPATASISAVGGPGQIVVSWAAVAGATGYDLYRSVYGGYASAIQINLPATTYTDTAVTNGISYGYQVVPVNGAGLGGYSNQVFATPGDSAGATPTGLSASPNGTTAVALAWNAAPAATSYNVYRSTTPGGEGSVPAVTGVSEPYTNAGLSASTAYYFQVTAVYGVGESAKSNEASATTGGTAPAAPLVITAVPSSGQVQLRWTASTGAASYNLYRCLTQTGVFTAYQMGLTSTSFTDTGVTNGETYYYYVTAVNSVGASVKSTTVSATPGNTTLAAPAGLTASASGSTSVALSWNAVTGASSYNVYRATSSGGEGSVPVICGITSASYTDTSLTTSTTYYYEVTTVGTDGESAKSNEASATTGGTLPAAPATIAAVPGSGQIQINWSVVSGASSYILYRSVSSTSSFVAYQMGLSTTTYTDTGLTNGVTYYYYVKAVNSAGAGAASSTAQAAPGDTTLAAPTGLTASSSGSTSISLSWNAVTGVTSYNVYRATASGAEGSVPVAINVSGTTYSNTGLTASTAYYFEVTAVSAAGESAKSNEASATTGGTLLAAPASITAVPGSSQVQLNWSTVSGAASYNLFRNTASGTFTLYQLGLTTNSYLDTAVTNGVTYGYYVAADNSAGQGASSATVYAAPGDTASAAPTGLAASVSGTTSAVLAWNTVTGATSYNVYRATTSGGEGSDPIATGVYSGSYTNTGLSTSTTYYYEVTAVNTAGESSKSNEASMTTGSTSLGGPGSFTATPGNAQVSLSWSTVTGASGYNLCRNVAGGGFSLYQLGLSTNSYTDTGVTNGISYGYYVAAVDSAGQGTHSSTAYATPSGAVPAAPYGLAATPSGATAVALTWVAVPGAATYNIYRATTSGGEGATPVVTGVTADVYTNSGLSISTAYYYQVTAVNSIGESSKSAEATATTGATAPSAPSAISADPGNGVVTLNWSASTGATSYNLNRNVAGGNTTLYQSGLTTNTYSDTGITNGISYGYSVNAVNSSGQGSPSGYAYAVPGDTAPAAPTGLTASPSGTTAIALTWNAVLGATTYDIYRSTTSGGEGSTPVVTGISSTSYTNSGLTTSTAYYYEVTAVSSAGEGAKSNEASATTGGTALGAPTGLTATPSSGQIALSWTAVSGASRYNLYRSLVAYGSFTAYQIGLTTTSYTDTNVTNGVTYYYYVAAVSSAGSGTNSSTVSATPGDTAPAAPANLTASSSSSTSIALSWTASPGASSYNVFIGTASGAEGATPIATLITNTTYTSTGLTSGTAYYYKVSAVNTAGESGKSNEATAVPGGTVLPAPVAVTAVATSGQVVVNWSSVSGASTYNLYRNVESGTFALYELGLTTTTLTDTAVTNGVTYGYEIAANDSAGLGAISSAAYATPGYVPPAAPTDLTATSFGTTQPTEIQLSWNAVPEATSYNLYRSTTSGGEGSVPVKIGIPIQTGVLLMDNYNDTGLASATTYYYKVTAVTSAGEGPQSNEAHATDGTTVLAAPNIEVTAGSAQVSVEWSSVTGAATYNLYRNVQGAAFVLYQAGLTATNFTDTGLTNGVTYGYYVCAVSSAGVGTASATVYGTPGDSALPAPTGLTAVGTTASPFEVTLAWNSVPAATSYNIYRGTYSGGEGSAPYFNAALRTDTNVSQNTEYFYQITAVGPAGESPRSNEAEAIVGGTISTGFDLFLYPGAVTVARSANGSVAVQVPAASNFSGPVNLTLSGVPAGVTGFCYGPSITVDPTTHFGEGFDVWFNVSSSATPGTYLITLTGTAGAAASYSYADTVTIALTVD